MVVSIISRVARVDDLGASGFVVNLACAEAALRSWPTAFLGPLFEGRVPHSSLIEPP